MALRSAHRKAAPLLLATAALLAAQRAAASPVVLDFSVLPPAPWTFNECDSAGQAGVTGGIMTITSPTCYEFDLPYGLGEWHQKVDNAKGWAVEARLRIDPSSDANPDGVVLFWIHDHTNLVIVGFDKGNVLLQYPQGATFPMDTTDGFHVYRVVGVLDQIRIYVDGALAINQTLTINGAGTDVLSFGDGDGSGYSLSYWDYFWYDVDGCAEGQCDPMACAEAHPCDDGDACTKDDMCKGGICEGKPVTCPASDDCHQGACDSTLGCTELPAPDGTSCAGGVCAGGACMGSPAAATSGGGSEAVSSSAESGGSGGTGGSGGGEVPLYGRAGCYCGVGETTGEAPVWLGLAVAALARVRRRMAPSRGRPIPATGTTRRAPPPTSAGRATASRRSS